MMPLSTFFVSWIPTNNCCLDKNKIPSKSLDINFYFKDDNQENVLYINKPFTLEFSDSLNKNCELGIEYIVEINFNPNNNSKSKCDLLKYFKESNLNLWNFELKLFFKKNQTDKDKKHFVMCSGNILSNGLVEFAIIDLNNVTYTDNLPNLIYTIIKRVIHNDNHHQAKIDNLIPVIEKSQFKFSKIADNLICEIKRLEYQAKILSQKKISFPDFKSVEELKCQAKGYYVYLKAFLECFKDNLAHEEKILKTPNFVIESLEITYNRLKNKIESMKYKYGLLLTIIALIISGNILIKNEYYNFKWVKGIKLYIVEFFIFFIAVFFAYFILKGNPINIFYSIKEKIQNYLLYYEKQGRLKFINDLSMINLLSYKFSEIKFLFINLLIVNLILWSIDKLNLIIVYTFLVFATIILDYIFFRKKIKKIFKKPC